MQDNFAHNNADNSRKSELRVFIFLIVFLAPILATIIVLGYGFIVWVNHLVFGPPTV